MPNPIDNPELYDVVLLANRQAPGLAEVVGASTPRGWDERKGLGLSGSTLAQVGDPLPDFTINVYLWESAHFAAWDSWKMLVERGARGSRYTPQDIYYPDLDEMGITRCVILDWKQREKVDERGLYKYAIPCKEWRKPLPVYNVPAGSAASAQQGKTDPLDQYIKDLTQQAKDLAQ